MEFIELEITALLTSPAVLFGAAAFALVFLTGLAAEAVLRFEDLAERRRVRSLATREPMAKYRTPVVVEKDIVQ